VGNGGGERGRGGGGLCEHRDNVISRLEMQSC
jgi:hypothetical protein